MKLSQWAKSQGISYLTAWRMWDAGTLPVPAYQLPTGTVIVQTPSSAPEDGVALYARVSGSDQKADLDRQLARLSAFAAQKSWRVIETVREVGSGLNGHCPAMLKLLKNPAVKMIVVEHRERLVRFGFDYLEAALAASGRSIVVVEPEEINDDIVRDMTEVLTSMCARLYGKRSAKNKTRLALKAIGADQPALSSDMLETTEAA